MDDSKHLVIRHVDRSYQDITKDIADIVERDGRLWVRYQLGGKEYGFRKGNIEHENTPCEIDVKGDLISIKGGSPYAFAKVIQFGNWMKLFSDNGRGWLARKNDCRRIKNYAQDKSSNNPFAYFFHLSDTFKIEDGTGEPNDYLKKQYEYCRVINPKSALYYYLEGDQEARRQISGEVIFPFGINPSQKVAVENALSNQFSLIEGPPGTGKTQTILNIIANILSRRQTVGVVAGSNPATDNVFEKLDANGFGFLSASLGNKTRKDAFFNTAAPEPQIDNWDLGERYTELSNRYEDVFGNLSEVLSKQNEKALLRQELAELKIQKKHFEKKYPKAQLVFHRLSFWRKVKSTMILRFKLLLTSHKKPSKLTLSLAALRAFILFGVYRPVRILSCDSTLITNLEKDYLCLKERELKEQILNIEKSLIGLSSKKLMRDSKELSLALFRHYLAKNRKGLEIKSFTSENYKTDFGSFVQQYPLILSTTNSLRNCVEKSSLLDYLIIDESSQVDLVTAAMSLSRAKNVVIVGDLKQISNFPSESALLQRDEIEARFQVPQAYNFYTQSILSSISDIYGSQLARVMLREHYRCHPAIIGFCNKQFYNNELLVMTEEESREDPFLVYRLKEGNHARKLINESGLFSQREISVIKDEVLREARLASSDPEEIGVIAPYRAHVNKTVDSMGRNNLDVDTVYKFQGREKKVIIFSTVANSINDFIDRADTVNVAVSRAVDQFVLVAGHRIFDEQDSNIASLIRYVDYQTVGQGLVQSKTSSIFDLLYKEQGQLLRQVFKNTKKRSAYDSENLMDMLLSDILKREEYKHLTYGLHVQLNDIVKDANDLNPEQASFAANPWSHIDFLIYSKIDLQPVLAIEVDGYQFHGGNKAQQERDEIKNQILDSIGLKLLRLKTNESDERGRIMAALK